MTEKHEDLIEGLNFQADMALDFAEDEPDPEDLAFAHLLRRSASALKLLLAENSRLKEALTGVLDEYEGVYDRSGIVEGCAPYQSDEAKEACKKGRAALNGEPS
jgi:hypothetical protein